MTLFGAAGMIGAGTLLECFAEPRVEFDACLFKGETENALLALPFRAAYMFRPATFSR